MTEINIKCLKIPTGGWQTSWLFTQHSRGVELRATQNKSSQWQGGGLEPGTTRFQVQHPCCLFILLFYCHSLASFFSACIVDLAGCIIGPSRVLWPHSYRGLVTFDVSGCWWCQSSCVVSPNSNTRACVQAMEGLIGGCKPPVTGFYQNPCSCHYL